MRRFVRGLVSIESNNSELTLLQAYIEATGLTQEELASRLKLHRHTIANIADGRPHRRSTSMKIANFTGLPEDVIYACSRRPQWSLDVEGHRASLHHDAA